MFYYLDYVANLSFCKRSAFRDLVPPGKALPATGGVLGDKDGMVLHGCLPTVVGRFGIGKTRDYKFAGMLEDFFEGDFD